jgi:hypothetical protein
MAVTLFAARSADPLVEASHWLVQPDGRWFAIGISESIEASFSGVTAEGAIRPLAERPEEGVLVWREADGEIAEIQWPTKTLAFELFRYAGEPVS